MARCARGVGLEGHMPGKTDTFRGRRRQRVRLGSMRTLGLPQAERALRRSHSPCCDSSIVT